MIKNKDRQDECLIELLLDQYSRKQSTGQTKLPLKTGIEKDCRAPARCFFLSRSREKETLVSEKRTDKLEIEANSEIRIKVAKANKVTSLRESCPKSSD